MSLLKSFNYRKEAWAMQKLFMKKSIEKMDKCPRYWKQWVLRCPPKKKMNKICFKEHSRIRITTIYIFHTHAHLDLRVWHFSPWILILTLQCIQWKYVFIFILTWAPHKLFRCRQKEGKVINALVRIQKYYILSDLRVLHEEKVSYVLFSKF